MHFWQQLAITKKKHKSRDGNRTTNGQRKTHEEVKGQEKKNRSGTNVS